MRSRAARARSGWLPPIARSTRHEGETSEAFRMGYGDCGRGSGERPRRRRGKARVQGHADAARRKVARSRFGPSASGGGHARRSEEHTSELQYLMRISYAVFCLKKKTNRIKHIT